jgi:hypothetical protein
MNNNLAGEAIMKFLKMLGIVVSIGIFIIGLAMGGCVISAFGDEPVVINETFVYQFDGGVLLSKTKIDEEEYKKWSKGHVLRDFYISPNASDIYILKGYQGKWIKGGVDQEPPAQAVLDVWNRKEDGHIDRGLEKTFHYVIKGTSAIEDTSKYPALQPKRESLGPPPEPETLHKEQAREIRTFLNTLVKRIEKLERLNGINKELPRRKPDAIIKSYP